MMKSWSLLLISILFILSSTLSAQVLWRSAKTMKKGSFIAKSQLFYMDFNKAYNAADEKWDGNKKDMSWSGTNLMAGYALTNKWEVMAHASVNLKSYKFNNTDESITALGDIFLKTRYSIFPHSKKQHGLVLIGSARFATGKNEESPSFLNTGDGSMDFALGGIYSSAWINGFRTHIKANYWLNGSTDSDVNVGDEFKFIAKMDRKISKKVFLFATYIFYGKGENKFDGNKVGGDKSRHYLNLGGVFKPKKGLFIRPKTLVFLGGKNGSIFSVKPMFDIWYVFNLGK